jgi:hypothetical protein
MWRIPQPWPSSLLNGERDRVRGRRHPWSRLFLRAGGFAPTYPRWGEVLRSALGLAAGGRHA